MGEEVGGGVIAVGKRGGGYSGRQEGGRGWYALDLNAKGHLRVTSGRRERWGRRERQTATT